MRSLFLFGMRYGEYWREWLTLRGATPMVIGPPGSVFIMSQNIHRSVIYIITLSYNNCFLSFIIYSCYHLASISEKKKESISKVQFCICFRTQKLRIFYQPLQGLET